MRTVRSQVTQQRRNSAAGQRCVCTALLSSAKVPCVTARATSHNKAGGLPACTPRTGPGIINPLFGLAAPPFFGYLFVFSPEQFARPLQLAVLQASSSCRSPALDDDMDYYLDDRHQLVMLEPTPLQPSYRPHAQLLCSFHGAPRPSSTQRRTCPVVEQIGLKPLIRRHTALQLPAPFTARKRDCQQHERGADAGRQLPKSNDRCQRPR